MRIVVVVIALGAALTGCDPSQTLLRADLLPFLREPLIEECCACLASSTSPVLGPDEGCDDAVVDDVTPCLCEQDGAQCREALRDGVPILVVGACVEPVGPCGEACEGTLAYP